MHTSVRSVIGSNGKHKESFTVIVEGNIASGKTTFLEHFKKNNNVETCEEPVKKWRDVNGYNALAKMYEDPSRWSLTLQTYVQLTMLEQHLKETDKPVKLMERSIYSAKYCFVENLYNSGLMPGLEYTVLTEWFNWIIKNNQCKVDLIVYLQAKPETVFRRIQERNRREEFNITLEYLKKLHDLHEEWLVKGTKFPLPSKVLVIPADKDLEEMHQIYYQREKEILCGVS
ncbi:thymidine kinase 2, mitochondrial-like [Saccostrea echinata]|uniref:thymidine kinase 2, mitochondrial-like n=1 Tax=Saccostrea echinata TaxID=191078 RepID=UPI002A7F8CA9|nr:thymidine kinase 2, mitochondrial-like [Saccostrea echinata]